MKIGIVGWGIEGQSAFNYFGPEHSYLIANEHQRNDFPPKSDSVKIQYLPFDKPAGLTGNVTTLSYLDGLELCDKVIYSPTAYKNLQKKFGDNKAFWNKATTIRHIFFETVKTKNIIGVTGTKGKGTTSTLIAKMLEAAGKKVYLGGNIGKSVLDFVHEVQPDDWVVLELSSFQLYQFPYSPRIGVCLMITPEHLDWHSDMTDYVQAKSNLFRHQKTDDIAIYYSKNEYSTQIAGLSSGKKIPYYEKPGATVQEDEMIIIEEDIEVLHKDKVKLLGEHNLQNVCAATTAVWFSLPVRQAQGTLSDNRRVSEVKGQVKVEAIRKVLTTFSGLEHRLEFVRELKGIKYYDDSFGTAPETAIVAMKAFKQPKVMILGGSDKGIPFDSLVDEVVKSSVRHVVAIGDTAPKITELLRERGFTALTEGLNNMPQIVAAAKEKAQSGDVVLLSAGCASFGLFHDYKDRGNQFKQAVLSLQ